VQYFHKRCISDRVQDRLFSHGLDPPFKLTLEPFINGAFIRQSPAWLTSGRAGFGMIKYISPGYLINNLQKPPQYTAAPPFGPESGSLRKEMLTASDGHIKI
jgi:hypothetical protein